jgi:hypothetical protein
VIGGVVGAWIGEGREGIETVVGRMEAKVVEGLNAGDWVDDTEVRG